ncbi:MAG: hypothetical protein H7Z75_15410 [Ferruginibacter sp.]|nr:hypothetical protein [Cytophagales bacterium]
MKPNPLLSILLGLFIAGQAVAQTTPADAGTNRRAELAATTPEQRAERQTAQMKEKLSLTADQETRVAAINLNYAQQMQPLLEGGARNRNTLKQVRDLASSKDDELKKVLDQDQYKQYAAFRDEQKDRVKQARGRRNNR